MAPDHKYIKVCGQRVQILLASIMVPFVCCFVPALVTIQYEVMLGKYELNSLT